jgi:predicted DNA-binding transcriptional regulator YafY
MLLESTRAERVAVLTWRLLTAGELLTAEEAQRFGVSTRTIQRDLAEISRVLAVRPDYAGRWLAPEEMRISLY